MIIGKNVQNIHDVSTFMEEWKNSPIINECSIPCFMCADCSHSILQSSNKYLDLIFYSKNQKRIVGLIYISYIYV